MRDSECSINAGDAGDWMAISDWRGDVWFFDIVFVEEMDEEIAWGLMSDVG